MNQEAWGRWLRVVPLFVWALGLGCNSTGPSEPGQQRELPEFALETVEGKPFTLKREGGVLVLTQGGESSRPRALILHFFQPDCNACSAKMKALASLRGEFFARGLEVVGVGYRGEENAIRNAGRNVGYPILMGKGSALASNFARGDSLLIANSRGEVSSRKVDYQAGDEAQWKKHVESLVTGGTPTVEKPPKTALEVGDPFPLVRLDSLTTGKPLSLGVEEGRLAFRDESGQVRHPRAAVGFFSRY